MKTADSRSVMLALRGLLAGEDEDRNGERIAEYVIEKALAGHFGFFRLVFDLVDGKLHRTAEDETTFESGCVIVVSDDGREAGMAKAA